LKAFGYPTVNNKWNNTLITRSGTNELVLIDLRVPARPTSKVLEPQTKTGSAEIIDLLVVNYGKSVAVFYGDSTFFSVNIQTGAAIMFERHIDGFKFEASYDYVTNTLLIIRRFVVYIYNSADGSFRQSITLPKFFTNANLIDIPIRIRDSGLSLVQVWDNSRIYFLDMKRMVFLEDYYELPDTPGHNVAIHKLILHSSLISVRLENNKTGGQLLKVMRLKSDTREFCHPTCGYHCTDPFVACSSKKKVGLALIMGPILAGLAVLSLLICCEFHEKRINSQENDMDSFNKHLSIILPRVLEISEEKNIDRNSFRILIDERDASKSLVDSLMITRGGLNAKIGFSVMSKDRHSEKLLKDSSLSTI
jgi:hypothetical protein